MEKLRRNKIGRKLTPLTVTLFIILLLYSVSLILMLVWGLQTSLKDKYEFRKNIFGIPQQWLFSNYLTAFTAYGRKIHTEEGFRIIYLEEMMLNSFLYAGGCAVVKTLVTCLAAYVTCKFREYFFSKIVYAFVLFTMMLPIVGSLPSELAFAHTLGLWDHIWGMWIMQAHFLGMYYFVFHAMFRQIPKDYAEAVYIDGGGEWTVLLKIMLPMVRNTILIVILLNFIGYWNDYQTPMLYIPHHPTMAYGLYAFSMSTDQNLASVPMKLTGCMLMVLPILILFLVFRNKMIGNISMGGLKE